MRCAKRRLFSSRFPPMAKGTAGTVVFPYAGLLRLLLSPKPQIMSQKQTMFHTENAGMPSKSALVALGVRFPGGGGSRER